MRSILGRTPSVVTPWRNSTTPTNANSNRRLRLSLPSTHRFTIHAEVYRPGPASPSRRAHVLPLPAAHPDHGRPTSQAPRILDTRSTGHGR